MPWLVSCLGWCEHRPLRGRDEEPSARDDPRATDVGSCSRDAILRWRAGDRPGHRVGRPRGHGGARCRDDPSPACRLCGDRPCRPMPSGRAPSHGRPSACPGRRTRAPWSGVGVACGGAWVACGEVGLAGLRTTTAIARRGGHGGRLRHDRLGRDRRRLSRGSRRRRDGWSRRLLRTRIPGRTGAGGCRVDGRSGRRRRREWRGSARSGPWSRRRFRRSGRRRSPGSEPARTSP